MILSLGPGGVAPQLNISTSPGKGGRTIPGGKLIVRTSVSVTVLPPHGPALTAVALMVTKNAPMAFAVPEIRPGVHPSELSWQIVKPSGRPVASKLVGLLLAVI